FRLGSKARAAGGAGQDQRVEVELRQDLADEPTVGARLDVVELEQLLRMPFRSVEGSGAAPATHGAGGETRESIDGCAHVAEVCAVCGATSNAAPSTFDCGRRGPVDESPCASARTPPHPPASIASSASSPTSAPAKPGRRCCSASTSS